MTSKATMAMADTSPPRPVMIALGASNLSRGLSWLIATARQRLGPADLLVAAGHGRSYGAHSRVAWRRLPSILHCGLWRGIDRHPLAAGQRPAFAIVTDIGNDLLYGFTVKQTAAWVRECLSRLAERGVSTAVTGLPLASVARAGPLRYRLLKTVFVPGCRLSLTELQSAAGQLDEAVRGIASEFSAEVIEQPGNWYGFDPIHVRRQHLRDLWGVATAAWGWSGTATPLRSPLAEWARIGAQAAEVRSLAGVMRFTSQPVICWKDGSTLNLY